MSIPYPVYVTSATTECAYCHAVVGSEEAIKAQPLITFRQLLTVIMSTAVHAPSLLGDILFKEMDQVSYCTTCRPIVAERRQSEQLKFAGSMLLALLLMVGIPVILMMT